MQTYIVQRGDTLYGISRQFGVSVDSLKSVNNLSSNLINVEMVLRIPSTDTTFLYVVKKGDTLYSISKVYDVSVSDLISLNNLSSNIISVGQELRIPIYGSSIENYVVKKGDTLYSLSKQFGISVDDLKKINNLTSDNLNIGQVLVFSNDVVDDNNLSGMSCYGEGYVPQQFVTYTVKSGDSLYVIAKKYDVSIDSLKRLNNLTSNNLSVGQVLKIKEVY